MPVAIGIKATNTSSAPILTLWDEVGRLEDMPSMRAMGYPPHVTLAIYDQLEPPDVVEALAVAFAGKAPFRLSFRGVGHFDNDPMVLWAAPTGHGPLSQAHAAIHAMIDPQHCRLHYRPGNWVPHCTLGVRIAAGKREQALALTRRPIAPFEVIFDCADIVRFSPIEVVEERPLLAT